MTESITDEFHKVVTGLRSRCGASRFVRKRPASVRLVRNQSKKLPTSIPTALEQLLVEVGRSLELQWDVLPRHRRDLPRGLKRIASGFLSTNHLATESSWSTSGWSGAIRLSHGVYARSSEVVLIGEPLAGPPQFEIEQDLNSFLWHWTRLGYVDLTEKGQLAPFRDPRTGALDSDGRNGRRWRDFLGCVDE